MIEKLLADLVVAFLKPIFNWFARRKAAKEYAEEQSTRDVSLKDSQRIRDDATAQEEVNHVQTQQELDHLRSDAAADRGSSMQSDDVNAAISAANRGVR